MGVTLCSNMLLLSELYMLILRIGTQRQRGLILLEVYKMGFRIGSRRNILEMTCRIEAVAIQLPKSSQNQRSEFLPK